MATLATAVKLLAVVCVAIPLITERKNYGFVVAIWKQFRVAMIGETLLVLAATIVAATALGAVPTLSWGWAKLLIGENGNLAVAPFTEAIGSPHYVVKLGAALYFVALILVVPYFSEMEEEVLREGRSRNWSAITCQAIVFGLSHCLLAGVPLAAGIALVIPGIFFGWKYKRTFDRISGQCEWEWEAEDKAIEVSTAYHALYNTILIAVLVLVLALANPS